MKGGGGLGCVEGCIIAEELAYGCSGISTAINGSGLAVKQNFAKFKDI
jgi:acyl-CoA dehydrogenase